MARKKKSDEEDTQIHCGKKVSYLDRLLVAYRAGRDVMDEQGNPANSDRVASSIVGEYRSKGQCLKDKESGVSYDGPLYAHLLTALEAAETRGRILEHAVTCSVPHCRRCVELCAVQPAIPLESTRQEGLFV